MAPDQEAVNTFVSITGDDEATAIQRLEEHHGSLYEALDAHFNEEDRNLLVLDLSSSRQRSEYMNINDPVPFASNSFPPLPSSNRSPFASHPREMNEMGVTGHSVDAPNSHPASDLARAVSLSLQTSDESEDVGDLPLVRRWRIRASSAPPPDNNILHQQQIRTNFPSEWRGILSEDHDEASIFGGRYYFPRMHSHLFQNGLSAYLHPYWRHRVNPPSTSIIAQRVVREQQDDEFLASLQADREAEMKGKEVAEAALAEERLREEAMSRKLLEEKEDERKLTAKEASLPQEPACDDANAVNLLVRMPDGSRRGRRFLKSDKLQSLFDFIDVGRVVKPGSYRLVRPYPRRAFGDGESSSTIGELGLTSKQEALYLERI